MSTLSSQPNLPKPWDAATFERISERYFGWHTTQFSRAWEYPWVAGCLDLRPGARVLDAGAGRSPLPFFCAESGAATYTVDVGSSELNKGWGFFDYGAIEPAIVSVNASFLELSWAKEGDFDFVLSVSVMEHLRAAERRQAWHEFKRILKVDGRLVLTIDLEPDGIRIWNRSQGRIIESPAEHGTLSALCQELEGLGFILTKQELCPVSSELAKSIGLVFTKAAEPGASHVRTAVVGESTTAGLNPARRILFGCVADHHPKYLAQALRLLQSVRWFGGSMSGANFFVCVVQEVDSAYVREFERLGAFVRVVPRLSPLHPPSNKLQFLEQPELSAYDTVILLDCDTLVTQDPTPFMQAGTFAARMADFATVPPEILARIFQHFSVPLPSPDYRTTCNDTAIIWYCNSGVLIFPSDLISQFVPVWRDYNLRLIQQLELLAPREYFCDQVSLSLAFAAHPVPFTELPPCMNFPLHVAEQYMPPAVAESDPVILHYHDRVDSAGYLLPTPFPKAQRRIQLFNDRLNQARQKNFNNRLFWDYRYSQQPELGSGIGSRGAVLSYKRELLRVLASDRQPRSILDVGCGDLAVVSGLPAQVYTGIDISPIVIQQNQAKAPDRKFICGDFLELALGPADLVLCFDVLIHLSSAPQYEAFVEHLVSLTEQAGIISGFEQEPTDGQGMVFYHEPLSHTLQRLGAQNIRQVGAYNQVLVYSYEGRTWPQQPMPSQNTLRSPVFVVGCMRSGTTLLADLLGEFPGIVHCPFELKRIWSSTGGVAMASPRTRDLTCEQLRATDVRPGQCEALTQAFLQERGKHAAGKQSDALFLNKNPHLANKLPFVNALFPDARFIWIYRPLPQVAGSLKQLFKRVQENQETWHYWPESDAQTTARCWHARYGKEFPSGCDPQRVFPGGDINYLAEYWLETNRAIGEYLTTLPTNRWLAISEDALIHDPVQQLAYVLAFLGQPLHIPAGMLAQVDRTRNDPRKSPLTPEETETLEDYYELHRGEIDALFPPVNPSEVHPAMLESDALVGQLQALIQNQEAQLAALRSERQQLQSALEEQGRWAHELEAAVREQQRTIQTYHKWLGALVPLARLMRRLRELVSEGAPRSKG